MHFSRNNVEEKFVVINMSVCVFCNRRMSRVWRAPRAGDAGVHVPLRGLHHARGHERGYSRHDRHDEHRPRHRGKWRIFK